MTTCSRKRFILALPALVLVLPGCAAGGAGASGGGGVRRSSYRIAAEELDQVSELDAYSAIQRLRPGWLRGGTRGALPGLILDGSPQSGGIDVLRSLRSTELASIELMSASDATTRYGTGYPGGAIVATTRRR